MNTNKNLYTIILDYEGGTYIKQIEAKSETDSFSIWLDNLDYSFIAGLGKSGYQKVCSFWNEEKTVLPLNESYNVWCLTFTVRNRLFLINIIKTAKL